MKVDIEKSKKLVKLSILALLLTYAAFFCYGAIMAFDFCNGPMGPADSSERSACFQLNHSAYQRLPLLIDHPAFADCSFLRLKRGNYWVIPPFSVLTRSRGQAAKANFCLGVMPPRAIFGRS